MSCKTAKDSIKSLFTDPKNRHIFNSPIYINPAYLKEYQELSKVVYSYTKEKYGIDVGLPFTYKDNSSTKNGSYKSLFTVDVNDDFMLAVDKVLLEQGKVDRITTPIPAYKYKTYTDNRLASITPGGQIFLQKEDITVEEFFDYFQGKDLKSETSQQKKKVLDNLRLKGYSIGKLKSIIDSKEKVNKFLLLHSESKLENQDYLTYYTAEEKITGNKNFNTKEKLFIETRASLDALYELQREELQEKTYFYSPDDEEFNGEDPFEGMLHPDDSFIPDLDYKIIEPSFDKVVRFKEEEVINLKERLKHNKRDLANNRGDVAITKKLLEQKDSILKRLNGDSESPGLLNEIVDLKSASAIEVFSLSAQADLDRVESLLQSTDPSDIKEISNVLDFYLKAANIADNVDNHPLYGDTNNFIVEGKSILPTYETAIFEDLLKKTKALKFEFDNKTKEAVFTEINNIRQIKKVGGVTKEELSAPMEDSNVIDAFILNPSIGLLSDNGPIPKASMIVLESTLLKHKQKKNVLEAKIQEAHDRIYNNPEYKNNKFLFWDSVNFNIFQSKNKDGRIDGNIIEKFTSTYKKGKEAVLNAHFNLLHVAHKQGTPEAYKYASDYLTDWYKRNARVLDVRKLSDIRQSFPDYKDSFSIDDKYEEEIKKQLGSEYKKVIAEQIEMLNDYRVQEKIYYDKLVSQDLTEAQIEAKIEVFSKTKNPLNVARSFHDNANFVVNNQTLNPSYEYIHSVPNEYKYKKNNKNQYIKTEEKTGFYDENFKVIENSPDLLNYHNVIVEVTNYMKENLPVDIQDQLSKVLSLPEYRRTIQDILFDPNATLLAKVSETYRRFREWVLGLIAVSPNSRFQETTIDPITGKTKYKVNPGIKTKNGEISRRLRIEKWALYDSLDLTNFEQFNNKTLVDLNKVSNKTLQILGNLLNTSADVSSIMREFPTADAKNFNILEKVEDVIKEHIATEQSFDLTKMLTDFTTLTSEYAGRQEALPTLEIFKNHYNSIKNGGESSLDEERKRANSSYENWFNRVALNNYTQIAKGKEIEEGQLDPYAEQYQQDHVESILRKGRVRTKDDAIIKRVEELRKTIPTTDLQAHKELNDIEKTLGKKLSGARIFESLMKQMIFTRLAWNLASSVTNLTEGQMANILAAESGIFFNPDLIWRANKITQASMVKNASFNLIPNKAARKLALLHLKWGTLQDGTNELQKNTVKTNLTKLTALSPFALTERIEYINQSPLILGILLDKKIKDRDGNESTVWDAFDDNMELKEEFMEHYNEWGSLEGKSLQEFKTQATEAVRTVHGDYSSLGGSMAKSTLLGKSAFTFKTFLPSILVKLLGKEQMNYALGKKVKGIYHSHTPVSAAFHGALVGAAFGPIGSLVGGAVFSTAAAFKNDAKFSDKTTPMSIVSETATMMKIMLKTFLRLGVNNITGKATIKQEDLSGTNFSELDQRNYLMLGSHLVITLSLYLAQLMVEAASAEGEEGEEPLMGEKTHNYLINITQQYLSQAVFITSPEGLKRAALSMPILDQLSNSAKHIEKSYRKSTGEGSLGAGLSHFTSEGMKKFVYVSPLKGDLGFEVTNKKVYDPSIFEDTFKPTDVLAQEQTKVIRKLYKEDLMDKYDDQFTEKEYRKMVNERYPVKKRGEDHNYIDLLESYREIQDLD